MIYPNCEVKSETALGFYSPWNIERTRMRRTKAEAAETRDAILTAAEHVFLERGLTQSTLMEIAGHAGVTRGAIYFHFHDKLDIFQALINRTRFPHEEIMLQAAACDHPNPLYVLEQSILTALELFITNERQQNLFTIIHQRCEYVGEIAPLVEHLKKPARMCFRFYRIARSCRTTRRAFQRMDFPFSRANPARRVGWPAQ